MIVILENPMSAEEVEILCARLEDSRIEVQDDHRTILHASLEDKEVIQAFCEETDNSIESVD